MGAGRCAGASRSFGSLGRPPVSTIAMMSGWHPHPPNYQAWQESGGREERRGGFRVAFAPAEFYSRQHVPIAVSKTSDKLPLQREDSRPCLGVRNTRPTRIPLPES